MCVLVACVRALVCACSVCACVGVCLQRVWMVVYVSTCVFACVQRVLCYAM